jgi:hypothetical protein
VQLEQDDFKGKDSTDAESDSESEGDEDINLDAPLPPHVITFEIDANIDITSHALRNMVAVDHSVKQSAAPQTSARSRSIQEKISAQPD